MDEYGAKKPAPDFIIRLTESQIRPWKVSTRALSRTLQAIQRLIDQREEDGDSMLAFGGLQTLPPEEATAKALRLIDIRSTSAAYAVAAPAHEFALRLISATGKGLRAPDT